MRTNLNGCFVAFSLGTPLFVTAQDRALRHVVTESRDYIESPIFSPFFFAFPVRMGGCMHRPPPPPPNSENILQTGSRTSDNTLDRLWHPKCGMELCFVAKNRNEVCSKRRAREERKYVDPVFPSCVL